MNSNIAILQPNLLACSAAPPSLQFVINSIDHKLACLIDLEECGAGECSIGLSFVLILWLRMVYYNETILTNHSDGYQFAKCIPDRR